MTTTTLTAAQPASHLDDDYALLHAAAAGPRGADFIVKIDNELEYVEWRGDQFARPWQVRRGFLGTDVAAHSNGATVTIEPSLGGGVTNSGACRVDRGVRRDEPDRQRQPDVG
jgi:hypothetical protein